MAICPKPCCGITSAAVFIAAGIVQLIAGLVFLKSKYVPQLAFPDFWTASANISVGSLVLVAASMWKLPHRHKTATYIARYHLIAALFVSSVVVNITTVTILVLGQDNVLISIQLEGEEYPTIESQLLVYANIASLTSPLVCTLVSVVALLTRCCPTELPRSNRPAPSRKRLRRALSESDPAFYSWVFPPDNVAPYVKDLKSEKTPRKTQPGTRNASDISLPLQLDNKTGVAKLPMCKRVLRMSPELIRERPSSAVSNSSAVFKEEISEIPVMAGQVVPVQVSRISFKNNTCAVPVSMPKVPERRSRSDEQTADKNHTSRGRRLDIENEDLGKRQAAFSSFRNSNGSNYKPRTDSYRNCIQGEASHHNRESSSFHMCDKRVAMESITEETPSQSPNGSSCHSPTQTSGYGSSPEMSIGETTPKQRWTDVARQNNYCNANKGIYRQNSVSPEEELHL